MLLCTSTYGQQSHRRIRKEVHQQSVRRNKERQAQRYFFPPLQLVRRRTQQAEAARGENTWQPATWDRRTPQNSLPRVTQRRYVHCSFSYVERNTVFYQYTHTIPVALLAGLALQAQRYFFPPLQLCVGVRNKQKRHEGRTRGNQPRRIGGRRKTPCHVLHNVGTYLVPSHTLNGTPFSTSTRIQYL
jgi:hypothetical protein